MFDDPKAAKARQKAANNAVTEKDRLLKTIGQLTMEQDCLRNKAASKS